MRLYGNLTQLFSNFHKNHNSKICYKWPLLLVLISYEAIEILSSQSHF